MALKNILVKGEYTIITFVFPTLVPSSAKNDTELQKTDDIMPNLMATGRSSATHLTPLHSRTAVLVHPRVTKGCEEGET